MIIAFWLLAKGEIGKHYPKNGGDSKMFVGNVESPVAIIKRKEVKDYADSTFYKLYNVWSKFHQGMGLPKLKSWAEHPMFIIDTIEMFETEFRKVGG